MKSIIKSLGFMTIMAAVCGANAATSRVSVTGKVTTRLPSIASYVSSVATGTVATTSSSSSTASTLLTNSECIDNYMGCLKGADNCGPNFEECTTNVLVHAKMPNCLSILSQCSSSGINDLFGTSSITSLSNIASKNSYDEVTRYTYPTDGSVLGQMITGAKISNQYDTTQCVKRYQSCLKKDNVCGADFELCTTNTEFKKQSIYCASTLARCQSDGLIELFGSTNTASAPASSSRIGIAIDEGAALAAVNAVATCYKVADQCILNACGANPNRCIADSSSISAKIADAINDGTTISTEELSNIASTISASEISGYIKGKCLDTIGGNKYCYATFLGNGQMPTNAQLRDEDNRDEIFGEAISARMNTAMKQKIQEIANKFDTKTKDKCLDTIKSCAMRTCGSGLGSVCYSLVFGQNGQKSINGKATYDEIKTGCEAIINTDSNCQYAAASANNNMYTYTYSDSTVFSTLFPQYEEGGADPISAIGTLNASLSATYNDAAIAKMKKQCSNVAVSCVKSMCGKDYVNCYRNRTDVYSNTYNTDEAAFNKSMNKVGGVLDYTIVTGLCVNTVKNADVCEEHLKIEAVKLDKEAIASWGDSVRGDWVTAANSLKVSQIVSDVTIGCKTITDNENCDTSAIEACDYVDSDGCLYDQKVTQSWTEYSLSQSAQNLFQEVLIDIEKEAQAKYNAKITKEQNVCLANNNGGIMGASDNGSAFMWVKLKSNKIPKDYPMKGLQTRNFVASNELYGSFCRARINVTSDDKNIQDLLGAKATAYFAVGDSFTCGSWIDTDTLKKITDVVAKKAREDAGEGSAKEKVTLAWSTVGGFLGGGLGGFFGMDALQKNGGSLGGLLSGQGIKETKESNAKAEECLDQIELARSDYSTYGATDESDKANRYKYLASAVDHANKAKRAASAAGAKGLSDIQFVSPGTYTAAKDAIDDTLKADSNMVDSLTEVRRALLQNCESIQGTKVTKCKPKAKSCSNKLASIGTAISNLPQSKDENVIKNAVIKIYNDMRSLNNDMVSGCGDIISAVSVPLESEITVTTDVAKKGRQASGGEFLGETESSKAFGENIASLNKICEKLIEGESDDDRTSRRNKNLIAGAAMSAVGSALGIGIAKSALDVKYENAANEAVKKWMEEVGDHIQCWVGGQELGSYGETISLEIE